MRIKSVIRPVVIVLSIVILSGTGIAFANSLLTREENQKRFIESLGDVNTELKSDFGVKEDGYIELDLAGLDRMLNFKNEYITDKEFIREITPLFDKLMSKQNQLSTKPLFLVSNDKSEIVMVQKEQDGTNVIRSYELNNGKWNYYESILEGNPMPEHLRID